MVNKEAKVQLIKSASDLEALSESVISQLPLGESPDPKKTTSLQNFLQFTSNTLGPFTVAFVYRRESYVQPSLDLLVLWPRPLQLRSDAQKMREIAAEHAKFVGCLDQTMDSFLKIIDCRRYPSAESLQAELIIKSQQAASAQLLTCASFKTE